MCLGIPGKVVEIFEANELKMAKIDFGGAIREGCLEYVPEAVVGDYVIVHVGFAISIVSEDEAQETLRMIREINDLNAEIGGPFVEDAAG
jgi:hydrogenase expression/formation protein HypC